ncbi:MAG: SDR family oxidoreductase [Enterococcus sp.]
MSKTWLITGVSSGFGYNMTEQLLAKGDTVIGTVRNTTKVQGLIDTYPDTFDCMILDVTDTKAIYAVVKEAYTRHSKIDVLINNAGYGLFGAAEELTDEQVQLILDTNLVGPITMIRAILPYMREAGEGRIIQISSYGGQVAFAGNSMYHASKFGIEGFCESVAQEVAPFGIGVSIIEPGGARTEFRYSSAHVAQENPAYEGNPAHAFKAMLDPKNGLAVGDPAKMAQQIIESADITPAPLHLVLGSGALKSTIERLEQRLDEYKQETEYAKFSDIPEENK